MDEPNNADNSEHDVASDTAVAAEGRAQHEDGDIRLIGQFHHSQPAIAAPIFVEATGRVATHNDDRLVDQISSSTSISMRNMLRQGHRDEFSVRNERRGPAPLQSLYGDGTPIRNRARLHETKHHRRDHHSRTQVTQSHSERRPPPQQVPASQVIVPSSIITNPASLRRYRHGIRRAAHSVQREFAQQVSRQLEALEKTFQEAVQHSDPEPHDIMETTEIRNLQQLATTSRPNQRCSSNMGISSNCQIRAVGGYDGDNDDDTSDGDMETAKRKRSE